jgi:mono/diheme cytochrome c family protein
MKTHTLILSATLACAPLFAGCGPERRDEPLTDPLTTDDPRVALGHRVFSQHCNQCHPGGAAGLAPAINDKPLPVNLIKTQVRQGLGTMPAFSEREISEEELDGVVRYLKGLRGLKG